MDGPCRQHYGSLEVISFAQGVGWSKGLLPRTGPEVPSILTTARQLPETNHSNDEWSVGCDKQRLSLFQASCELTEGDSLSRKDLVGVKHVRTFGRL